MQTISRDGTPIAFERSGQGPALVLVDGALCSRAFGPSPALAPLLAPHFTVVRYDRRGCGESGDTQPYAREREVEDIGALIREAVDHEPELKRLVAAGDRGGAVSYFMKSMVGVPAPAVFMMRLMPWLWRKLAAVAHTLPYDAAVMRGFLVPHERFASIRIPVLAMSGSKSPARLQTAAQAVAQAIPGARHASLPGQAHNVNPAVLASQAIAYFPD